MKKKILWLALSCLMVAALVLGSCAPAVTEEEEVAPPVEEEEEVTITEVVVEEEEPQYGGTYTFAITGWGTFEPAVPYPHHQWLPAYDSLLAADITRGPGGTGEIKIASTWVPDEYFIGFLAESWEYVDLEHITFTIRKGVRFHDKPPVDGRELTAEDVVASFEYYKSHPRSTIYVPAGTLEEDTHRASIDPNDKWKVIITLPTPSAVAAWRIGTSIVTVPAEIIDLDLADWRNMVGTGPFIIVDAVQGSSATYKKNPTYWQYDPFHPQNRLPYVDKLRLLVIPDPETQLAALRTGKVERLPFVGRESSLLLQESNPELLTSEIDPIYPLPIDWQNNVEPFTDIRVRRALAMAIDHPGIYEDFFEGAATRLAHPLAPLAGDAFTPLEELPESIRILFEHRPEEAKQLLAEAGYPDGFKTEIIIAQGDVDLISIVQANWREIGVEAEIKALEDGALWATVMAHTVPQISASYWGSANPYSLLGHKYHTVGGVPRLWNTTHTVDPFVEESWDVIITTLDPIERGRLLGELNLYVMEQVYDTSLPVPYSYIFWQPWLKGYHGEYQIGPSDDYHVGFVKYVWIDQDLKYEMTGRR